MIAAALPTGRLLNAVVRAARPDEDVIAGTAAALEAMERGFPRLVVTAEGEGLALVRSAAGRTRERLPTLVIVEPERLQRVTHAAGLRLAIAVRGVDDSPARIASLINHAAARSFADGILDGFAHASGRPLPAPFCGFARRVLEYPALYADLRRLSHGTGISVGALKARFRRRGLPSPFLYLRWLRILAAAHLLSSRPELSLTGAALLLGFSSGGNFCRTVSTVTGASPSALRQRSTLHRLVAGFARNYLAADRLTVWNPLHSIFLRRTA